MSKTHTIVLDTPIIGHQVVKQLVFKEPKWAQYMELGPLYRWVPRGDGNLVAVPDVEVVAKYAEKCLEEPKGEVLTMLQCGLADTLKIQDLFMGFFLAAEGAAAASKMSSETSSNNGSGDTPT